MLRSLHSAATGMTAQQNYIDVTSNNLANVNTAGFKKSRVNFQDLIYQIGRAPGVSTTQTTESPSGIQVGIGVRTASTQKEFAPCEGNQQPHRCGDQWRWLLPNEIANEPQAILAMVLSMWIKTEPVGGRIQTGANIVVPNEAIAIVGDDGSVATLGQLMLSSGQLQRRASITGAC